MRLFIAINFSDATKDKLLALSQQLASVARAGRFAAPANLHLTLAFLGECSTAERDTLKTIIAALGFTPFVIRIECVGRFQRGGQRRQSRGPSGDIWWAGLAQSPALLQLQADLVGQLSSAGWKLEKRKFHPHITLGRDVQTDSSPWQFEPFSQEVKTIDLMLSEQIGGQLRYTVL